MNNIDKSIIRHCKNCKWNSPNWFTGDFYCVLKHKASISGRLRALFCRFFKKEGEQE